LDGLTDEERPGRPASITAEQIEDVVVATLEAVPANATHWSRAKMAERTGLSRSTIGRIWKTFELKPHRADGFKLDGQDQERGSSHERLLRCRLFPRSGRLYGCAPRSAAAPNRPSCPRRTGRKKGTVPPDTASLTSPACSAKQPSAPLGLPKLVRRLVRVLREHADS